MVKQPLPSAVCPVCGTPGPMERSGKRCSRIAGHRKCKGVFQSAVGVNDWAECPTCGATGEDGMRACPQCQGQGWFFIRDRPL